MRNPEFAEQLQQIRRSGGWRRALGTAAIVCCFSSEALAADAQWTMGGQNIADTRDQPATGLNPANAAKLALKWTFTASGDITATPAVANGIVYFPDFAGNFFAVDAATGALIWKHQLSDWTGVPGDFARDDPAISGNLLILGDQGGEKSRWDGTEIVGPGAKVIAIDAHSGEKVWVTEADSFPTGKITSSPVVYNGVVYVGIASSEEGLAANKAVPCCITRGSLVALDVQTGRKLWQTYMVPDNHGMLNGYSGAGIWSSTPAIDQKRNMIYVGTGNNYSVPAAVEACNARNSLEPDCTDPRDYFDSVVALDLGTGSIKWARRAMDYDAWNVACIATARHNCPDPAGPDYDFGGAGPNLLTAKGLDIVGIGSKSGIYWALDPDDGSVRWKTQVGPGGPLGGIEWGTAADGDRIYVTIANRDGEAYRLQPTGAAVNGGSWAALDPASGKILWQTLTPGACTRASPGSIQGCMALAPASSAGGVVFGGSMNTDPAAPTMFALDGSNGKVVWSFVTGSSVIAGPAIAGNTVYWGSGYGHFGPHTGTPNNKLFAFSLGK
jgi:polyvinyl alcohol dehydrogenase (cytochrome)